MKTIKYKDNKYSIPQSWSEVSLHQLKQYQKLEREDLSDNVRAVRVLAILSGIPYELLADDALSTVIPMFNSLSFLSEPIDTGKVSQHFKLNGQLFIVNTLTNATFREYAAFSEIDKRFTDEPEEAINYKLAVLCRRENESFKEVSDIFEARAKEFDSLDALTVQKVDAFFLNWSKIIRAASQAYLKQLEEVTRKEAELRSLLTQNTGGRLSVMKWLRLSSLRLSLFIIRKLKKY